MVRTRCYGLVGMMIPGLAECPRESVAELAL
jgi:hypothetical protein